MSAISQAQSLAHAYLVPGRQQLNSGKRSFTRS